MKPTEPGLKIAPGEGLGLLLILLLAIVLRFGWSGTRSFAFDEAYVSSAALHMIHGGPIATIGMPSSASVPNLPGAIWLFAIPFAISPDPLFASAFVGVLSLITLALTWWLVRRSFGSLPALAAALYLAATPYSVLYARSIWAQNLLPLFGVLWLAVAYQAWTSQKRQRLWMALTVIVAGAAIEVHFAGITFALATVWLAIRSRGWQRSKIGGALIGIGVIALTILPALYRVLIIEPAILHQFGNALNNPAQIDLSAPIQLFNLATGRDWAFLLLGDRDPFGDRWLPGAAIAVLLIIGIAVAIRVNLFPRANGGKENSAGTKFVSLPLKVREGKGVRVLTELSLITLLTSILWLIWHKTAPLPHYQLTALPAIATLIGMGMAGLRQRGWQIGALTILIVSAGIWTYQIGFSLNQAGQVETPHGLGTPLLVVQTAATAPPIAQPVILFTHGDDSTVDGEPAVFSALWWNRGSAARIVNGETTLILPSTPTTLMATVAPFQAWEELRDAGLLANPHESPRREGAPPFVWIAYDGQTPPQGFTTLTPTPFTDGLTLIGWRVRAVGPRLRFSTLWQVRSTPTMTALQQFDHLRTASTLDAQPFKGSDVPISIHTLRAGDTAIIMADFYPQDFPAAISGKPTQFWIDVGHYTLADLKRIPLLDGSADHVRLGPFTWPPAT